jgi:hypothetical protein
MPTREQIIGRRLRGGRWHRAQLPAERDERLGAFARFGADGVRDYEDGVRSASVCESL